MDVIQCSIDTPPIKNESIDGIVYCHNVIQHTPSVEKTAKALFEITGTGGEFVFNCYPVNDQGLIRYIKFHIVYKTLRVVLSKLPFVVILQYARLVSILRLVPGLGLFLEKSGFVYQGDVPTIEDETPASRLKRRFKAALLNTFDYFGSHQYQHHKSDFEILKLAIELQPDASKILNRDKYFMRPPKIGCALRIFR